ncbi:Pentapeptide repeat-containing protein [Roseovarius marisflavi]|uniref:Pentapeptide repeat-containing protein n=1 Tax=Roseovarius marisflavi TaxID=1054996 RepID=A0A1M6V181_9RHOB|nr:pentapeptide repeat-containing protein [Roseovarius marisflavi]SHK75200.1 Pentapeptide repeat-containing protein [Roseovarius marisflavi]
MQIYETYQGIVTHPLLWIFLGLTLVFYLVQGATRQKEKGWVSPETHIKAVAASLGLAGVPTLIFVVIGLTWLIVATTLLFGLYKLIWDMIWHAVPQGDDEVWPWRFSLAQVAALTTVLGAVIALPLTINRLLLSRRQTETVEQGHITDRINKAVEGLGAEKTVKRDGDERTEANLEVRIGSIYALERLSQDSERDHIQIMEILCAYIRQNAGREDVALPEGEVTPEAWRDWAKQGHEHPRLDVDVALKVIERRGAARKQLEKNQNPPYRLGLERAPLRKIILSQRDLTGADLRNAELQGADLWRAQLQGANLWRAQLQEAHLWDAQLQGADLWDAQLQGANLGGAQLQGANLGGAQLQGAKLWHAELQGAHLWDAQFDENTNLSVATLRGATLRFMNCTNIPQLTEHLEGMFGDASVTLPGGHGPEHASWPRHWPRFELGFRQFEE